MGDLIEFPTIAGPTSNRECPKCGGQWWIVQGVIIDKDTESIGGYAGVPKCYDCDRGSD